MVRGGRTWYAYFIEEFQEFEALNVRSARVYSYLESGTLKQFTEAEGDTIDELIDALLSFRENGRLFGANRSKLNVKTENMLLTYQREVDGEIDSMLF